MSFREPAVNKDTFGGDLVNALLLRPVYREPLKKEEPETKPEELVTFATPNGSSMVGTGKSLRVAIRPNDVIEVREYQSLTGLMCVITLNDGRNHYVYGNFESVMNKLRGINE